MTTPAPPAVPVPVRILILYEDSRVAIAIAARAMDRGSVELARLEDSPALMQASGPADLVILCPFVEDPASPDESERNGAQLPVPVRELPPVLRVKRTAAGGLTVDATEDDLQAIEAIRPSAHEAARQLLLRLSDPDPEPGPGGTY